MSKLLKNSRWRRLPGLYRITERKMPGPEADLQRLTLYLPGGLLDRAEALAKKAGISSVQMYCEGLLQAAIENEDARGKLEELKERRGPLEGLDAIANDPDYLAEWTASVGTASRTADTAEPFSPDETNMQTATPTDHLAGFSHAAESVLRHAGRLGMDAEGFLPALRRGERVGPDSARELLQSLVDLERECQDAVSIDRRLAFALHRLAFESQILVTDAWPDLASDQATVDTIRLVQEAVDRVLSGEDIRYGTV